MFNDALGYRTQDALHIFSRLQQCAQATWQGTLVLVEVSGVVIVEVVVALATVVALVEALGVKGEVQKQLDEEFATNLAFIFRFVFIMRSGLFGCDLVSWYYTTATLHNALLRVLSVVSIMYSVVSPQALPVLVLQSYHILLEH